MNDDRNKRDLLEDLSQDAFEQAEDRMLESLLGDVRRRKRNRILAKRGAAAVSLIGIGAWAWMSTGIKKTNTVTLAIEDAPSVYQTIETTSSSAVIIATKKWEPDPLIVDAVTNDISIVDTDFVADVFEGREFLIAATEDGHGKQLIFLDELDGAL